MSINFKEKKRREVEKIMGDHERSMGGLWVVMLIVNST